MASWNPDFPTLKHGLCQVCSIYTPDGCFYSTQHMKIMTITMVGVRAVARTIVSNPENPRVGTANPHYPGDLVK